MTDEIILPRKQADELIAHAERIAKELQIKTENGHQIKINMDIVKHSLDVEQLINKIKNLTKNN